jgi:hypothetical protein
MTSVRWERAPTPMKVCLFSWIERAAYLVRVSLGLIEQVEAYAVNFVVMRANYEREVRSVRNVGGLLER